MKFVKVLLSLFGSAVSLWHNFSLFPETFEVAKTISMWPSLKSGSKVGKSSSNGNGDRRARNRAVSLVCSYPV